MDKKDKNNSSSKLFLHIWAPAVLPNDNANTNTDIGTNNKKVDTTRPEQTEGQVGFVVACNEDDTLTTDEAWDFINQNQLNGDELGKFSSDMDGGKQAYRFMAIIDDDVELNDDGMK